MSTNNIKNYVLAVAASEKADSTLLESLKASTTLSEFLTELNKQIKACSLSQPLITKIHKRLKNWQSRSNRAIVQGTKEHVIDQLINKSIVLEKFVLVAKQATPAKQQALQAKKEKAEALASKEAANKEAFDKAVASKQTAAGMTLSELIENQAAMLNVLKLYIETYKVEGLQQLVALAAQQPADKATPVVAKRGVKKAEAKRATNKELRKLVASSK